MVLVAGTMNVPEAAFVHQSFAAQGMNIHIADFPDIDVWPCC
jgi:hypothetical protein